MAVEGSLDLFSLPEILQMISQQGKTGILTVQGQQDIVAVSFLHGRIVAADSLAHTVEEGLSQVLVGERLLTAPDLARAHAENHAAGSRLLDLLVERRYLTRPQLLAALRLQTVHQIEALLRWQVGDFKFYGGDEVSYEEGFEPISVEDLLLRMLSEYSGTHPTAPSSPSTLAAAKPSPPGVVAPAPAPRAVPAAAAPRAAGAAAAASPATLGAPRANPTASPPRLAAAGTDQQATVQLRAAASGRTADPFPAAPRPATPTAPTAPAAPAGSAAPAGAGRRAAADDFAAPGARVVPGPGAGGGATRPRRAGAPDPESGELRLTGVPELPELALPALAPPSALPPLRPVPPLQSLQPRQSPPPSASSAASAWAPPAAPSPAAQPRPATPDHPPPPPSPPPSRSPAAATPLSPPAPAPGAPSAPATAATEPVPWPAAVMAPPPGAGAPPARPRLAGAAGGAAAGGAAPRPLKPVSPPAAGAAAASFGAASPIVPPDGPPLPRKFRQMQIERAEVPRRERWIVAALALGLAALLVTVVRRAPEALPLPFPWQQGERGAFLRNQRESLFNKIDGAAKTAFLRDGRFPDRLVQLRDSGLLSPADVLDPRGEPLLYSAREDSYNLQATEAGRPLGEGEARESIAGNFFLDPTLVQSAATTGPPVVLLD